MKLNFHNLAVITAISFSVLAIAWMFAPSQSLSLWGVEFNSSAGLLSRRGGALYAGIAVMFFLARRAEPSPTRRALVRGLVVSCVLLAVLGLFELSAGRAHRGILPAVFIEVAFSIAFLFVDRAHQTDGVGVVR